MSDVEKCKQFLRLSGTIIHWLKFLYENLKSCSIPILKGHDVSEWEEIRDRIPISLLNFWINPLNCTKMSDQQYHNDKLGKHNATNTIVHKIKSYSFINDWAISSSNDPITWLIFKNQPTVHMYFLHLLIVSELCSNYSSKNHVCTEYFTDTCNKNQCLLGFSQKANYNQNSKEINCFSGKFGDFCS